MGFSCLGWYLTILVAVMATAANILLRIGMDQSGGFAFDGPLEFVRNFTKFLFNPFFTTGLIAYFLSMMLWCRVLAFEQFSCAYPILIGISFMLVTLAAVIFLEESLSLWKAFGLVIIILGVFMSSLR